jgi:hypothetical protein
LGAWYCALKLGGLASFDLLRHLDLSIFSVS